MAVCEKLWWRLERRETAKNRFYHLTEMDHTRNLKQTWTILISVLLFNIWCMSSIFLESKGQQDKINFSESIWSPREVLSQVLNGKYPVTTEKYWLKK
jgi:hypothetical protein